MRNATLYPALVELAVSDTDYLSAPLCDTAYLSAPLCDTAYLSTLTRRGISLSTWR